ncbi:MAG: hypothetical protein HYW89_00905 [Candidatus Sungiibacteriota bacterium]|uniref:Uncharacterized protein n=1 Tax=Candidatus Sungiibacteriota bacterium TaxID=2750080 RepID=A0A7T5UQ49_9BACT|nr:MAG: hypothetical protein HYW89_00905 [Candidatus Sungbacteria bacterium]
MNRPQLILAVLLLAFFLGTSSGFASVSAIQDQLRVIQLKLIKERLKLIQEQTLKLKVEQPPAPAPKPAPTPPPEEMLKTLEQQKKLLEQAVASLRPKAIEDEANRIDKRLKEMRTELDTAGGGRLQELQKELVLLLEDQARVEAQTRELLEESLKARQAVLLREQVLRLEERIRLLPRPVAKPKVEAAVQTPTDVQLKVIKEQIEKAQLKLLQTQIKAVTDKIQQLKR